MTDDIIPLDEARLHRAEQETNTTPQNSVEENDEGALYHNRFHIYRFWSSHIPV